MSTPGGSDGRREDKRIVPGTRGSCARAIADVHTISSCGGLALVDDHLGNLTPELALVDPSLAEAARACLPWPGDCLAPRPRVRTLPATDVQLVDVVGPGDEVARASRWRRGGARRPAVAASWLVVAALVGSSLLAFVSSSSPSMPRIVSSDNPPPSKTRPAPAARCARVIRRNAASTAGTALVRSTGRIVIRWPSDRRAAYYNVVLLRGGTRVDLWPAKNVATYSPPQAVRIESGSNDLRYRWFVYPGYRSKGAVRFGPVLASGTVPARTSTPR
jgi:hypothetical protein